MYRQRIAIHKVSKIGYQLRGGHRGGGDLGKAEVRPTMALHQINFILVIFRFKKLLVQYVHIEKISWYEGQFCLIDARPERSRQHDQKRIDHGGAAQGKYQEHGKMDQPSFEAFGFDGGDNGHLGSVLK